MCEMFFENGYHDSRKERVVAIEYHPVGRRHELVPFSVFTVSEHVPDPEVEPVIDAMRSVKLRGWIAGIYNFDWCRRDKSLYYHLSGSGGRFYVSPICKEYRKPPRAAIWYDDGFVRPTNAGNSSHRPLSNGTLVKWGYDVLGKPVSILGNTANPFDEACHGETVYCSRCNDWLPEESTCRHCYWCDECAIFSTPSERCSCKVAA